MSKNFWDIRMSSETCAEILLYGEIVRRKPVNFWTGEAIEGQFVTPDGFLEAFENIKNSSEIIVRVNSPGGDLATGQAIYTLLKGLPGHKTGIVDSLAASAATLPLMAMDEVEMPAGARFMIHEAKAFVGNYLSQKEFELAANYLEVANTAAAETYSNKTGIAIEELREMMRDETWMTGRTAVEKGFVDKLLYEGVEPQMSADRKYIFAGNEKYSASMFASLPNDMPIRKSPAFFFSRRERHSDIKSDNIGGEKMITNEQELQKAYPELCAKLCEIAKMEGVIQERSRLKSIEQMSVGHGHIDMVEKAKYGETPMSAGDLAIALLKTQKKDEQDYLDAMKDDNAESGVLSVSAAPNDGVEMSDDEKRISMAKSIAKYAERRG